MVYPALLPLIRTTRLPVVDWTDAPVDLNGLVRFTERLNLVSARGLYSQPVLRFSSLRGRTVSYYRYVIRCACDSVGNKALSYLGNPRVLNKQYFYWNFPILRPIVLPLRLAVQMNIGVKHWWNHIDRVKAKYSEIKYRCDFFQSKYQNILPGIEPGPQNGVSATYETMRQFCKGQLVNTVGGIMARLGACKYLRKASISFIMPVRPHRTRLPLQGVPWNFIFGILRKSVEKIRVSLKSDKNNGYVKRRATHFFTTSLSVLLIMRNVSDKSCRENQNTHFVFGKFFSKNRVVYEMTWKNTVEADSPQMTKWLMRIACCTLKATKPHLEYVILIEMFARTHLNACLFNYENNLTPLSRVCG